MMPMSQVADVSILTHFSSLPDPRDNRGKEHLLLDILVIAICAVISGAEGWEDMAEYGRAKISWLNTFLALPHGIPSADTFARIFARLDPEQFQNCFMSWVKTIGMCLEAEIINLDGKTLRHSDDKSTGKKAIHLVSAWASNSRLVLAHRKVEEKSNEITAIPELLQLLELNGCIVTIDAMGCQKTIAATIVEQKADYVLALKGNQGKLYEDVQWLFEQAQAANFSAVDHDFYQSINKEHGRVEIRRYWTLSKLDYLEQSAQWQGLKTIVMVQSERRVQGQVSLETRYFISSLPSSAVQIAQAVRSHWTIENSLHWVLDVSFSEDKSRIRKDHAPENLALLRHLALNLLTQDNETKRGIAARRKKAAWDDSYLVKILTQ
jgi:predicted transposase YbfD/YdcC